MFLPVPSIKSRCHTSRYRNRLIGFIFLLTLAVVPAMSHAFECDNSGAAGVANDGGDVSRTACGSGASAGAFASTAVGLSALSSGNYSVAVGYNAETTALESVAVGSDSITLSSFATAVGQDASSGGIYSTSLGYGASTEKAESLAVGSAALAKGEDSTAVGYGAAAMSNQATALGHDAAANGVGGIAVGSRSLAVQADDIAIGNGAAANAQGAIALGANSDAGDNYGAAFGTLAQAMGWGSVAIGHAASAAGPQGTAVGRASDASSQSSTALGYRATATASYSTAIGFSAHSDQSYTLILGSIPGINSALDYSDVGMGTTSPLAPLHVSRDDGTASILVQENAAAPAGRTLFTLANRGNTKFELKETGSGTRWQFTNSGDAFRISKFGTGQVEFQVFNNGDAVLLGDLAIGGAFTEMSDRNQKHAIVPLDGEAILAKVAQVPISEWSYKTESADQRHIGPMAQDFYAAFGLASGDTRISARDMAGVNMAAIQALSHENRQLRARIDKLEAETSRLKTLNERVTAMENWVSERGVLTAYAESP